MSVCTAHWCAHNIVFTQLGSVTEGFKLCWRTGQKAHLETILLTLLHDLNITCTLLHLYFELDTCLFLEPQYLYHVTVLLCQK